MPALTAALVPFREVLSLPSEILLFLCLTVGVALAGGTWPAVTAAVGGSLLLNWYFTPPVGAFTISDPESLFALVVFVLVAAAVSTIVDIAARRTREAARGGPLEAADRTVLEAFAAEAAVALRHERLQEAAERARPLVANLLDMSRLQAGVLGVSPRPVALEEIVPRAVDDLGPSRDLALSRGLAEAMGGALVPEETPGGGLTMILTLPVATSS
ncbi:DUF4118 domain-containing protein [Nonomuraea rhizosphaerae]|uniref:DUF4118 domain-containing protein n=1 Tax=Nonomuraea rhizosphaerae TaxID=2665663 RepID=UPI001C5F8780